MIELDPQATPDQPEAIVYVPRPELHGRLTLRRRLGVVASHLDQKYGPDGWQDVDVGVPGQVQILVRNDRLDGYEHKED